MSGKLYLITLALVGLLVMTHLLSSTQPQPLEESKYKKNHKKNIYKSDTGKDVSEKETEKEKEHKHHHHHHHEKKYNEEEEFHRNASKQHNHTAHAEHHGYKYYKKHPKEEVKPQPIEPVKPVEPVEPTEPVEPVEPVEPTEPVEPEIEEEEEEEYTPEPEPVQPKPLPPTPVEYESVTIFEYKQCEPTCPSMCETGDNDCYKAAHQYLKCFQNTFSCQEWINYFETKWASDVMPREFFKCQKTCQPVESAYKEIQQCNVACALK